MSGKSYYGAIQVTNDHEDEIIEDGNVNSNNNKGSEASPLLPSSNKPATTAESKDSNHSTTHKQKQSIGIQTDPSYITQLYNTFSKHWTLLTFNWISPLLFIGNIQNQLNVNDLELLPLPSDCETNVVYEKFLKCWNYELEKATLSNNDVRGDGGISNKYNNDNGDDENGNNKNANVDISDIEQEFFFNQSNNSHIYNPNAYQPSLIRALYHAFGSDFVRAGLLKLIHDTNLFVGPQVLNRLIRFLRNKDAPLSYGLTLMLIGTFFFFVCLFVWLYVFSSDCTIYPLYPQPLSSHTSVHPPITLCPTYLHMQ